MGRGRGMAKCRRMAQRHRMGAVSENDAVSQNDAVDNPFARHGVADLVGRRTLKWQAYPRDVLPLWVAEMDTDLAEPVRDAVITAVARGEVGYPSGRDYPEALAAFAYGRWQWSVHPDTMRHTTDVMTGMANLVNYLTPADAAGDHDSCVSAVPGAADGHPACGTACLADRVRPAGPRRHRPPSPAACATGRRPVLVLCNPHNPTGTVASRAELEAISEVVARHDVACSPTRCTRRSRTPVVVTCRTRLSRRRRRPHRHGDLRVEGVERSRPQVRAAHHEQRG